MGTSNATGTVAFSEGATIYCAAAPLNAGVASCPVTSLHAGSPTLTATYAGDGSFPASSGTLVQTINRAPLTVIADDQSRNVGAANPALTAGYSGFVNGDSSAALSGAPALTTAADGASTVGDYPITATVGTLTSGDYNFSFVNGTLTVTPGITAAPVATAATGITGTGLTLHWGSVGGATGYSLDVAYDNGFTGFLSGYQTLDVGNGTTATLTGLIPGTTYFARVRTYHSGGISAASNVIATTTPTGAVSSILVDPVIPGKLYSAVDGAGIYLSDDGGATWSAATTQPNNLRMLAIALHPSVATTLFVATKGDGIFISTDSGDNWAACNNAGLSDLIVRSLVIDGTGTLYAGTSIGVFVSSDDGDTWSAINNGLP